LRQVVLGLLMAVALWPALGARAAGPALPPAPWRAIHIMAPGPDGIPLLERAVKERLAPLGTNVLVLELNYRFDFQKHPEVRDEVFWTRDQARGFTDLCRKQGIAVVPMLNCLGHQSWRANSLALLKRYPELEEPSELAADDEEFYCRSWCPSDPRVMAIVASLIGELVEAFEAPAFHVGMDEVFVIGSPRCERCRGQDPARLFARAVNDLHQVVTGQHEVPLMMWGDRLLDAQATGYGKWEAAANGTAPAIDQIPKDIIVCDWHYEKLSDYQGKPDRYRSLGILLEKGFRVIPASWKNPGPAQALLAEAQAAGSPRMLGYMATTWVSAPEFCRALLDPQAKVSPSARGAVESLESCFGKVR
jgi:hypothetical protein